MEIKKVINDIPDIIDMNQLDQTNLHFFKIFSLPVWLVIISISLSFVTQSVRAGTEDINLYYRYVPYEGPASTTGTTGQRPKQSSGASDTEAKKTGPTEQAKKPSENIGQESKEPSAATGTSGQAPASGSQAPTTSQSTQQSKEPKTEGSMSGEQKSPVKKPEKDTGEFPSGEFPSFTQVDINGDHYVTKDELKNFPDLLQVFDKIDAGKDGRLEQHEYQNLEMETKREGEVL